MNGPGHNLSEGSPIEVQSELLRSYIKTFERLHIIYLHVNGLLKEKKLNLMDERERKNDEVLELEQSYLDKSMDFSKTKKKNSDKAKTGFFSVFKKYMN